jgi:hypothetical protein
VEYSWFRPDYFGNEEFWIAYNHTMKSAQILRIFNDFRGSRYWASKRLNVTDTAVSQWLNAIRSGNVPPANRADRYKQLSALAAEIVATNGKCITHVGEVENARTAVIRERRKRRAAK